MVDRNTLVSYINQYLQIEQYRDYCPNGLQVEGKLNIKKIVSGVTANQALIDRAVKLQADMILVHHGFFWKNENPVITGIKAKRIAALLRHQLNLVAYHLPLDGHPEVGNNVLFGKALNIELMGEIPTGSGKNILLYGSWNKPISAEALNKKIYCLTGLNPIYIQGRQGLLKRVAWCTGGGQDFFESALNNEIDVFISGEIAERTVHIAREYQVDFFAAGHHATERYGIKALGEHLAEKFKLEHVFVDIESPV